MSIFKKAKNSEIPSSKWLEGKTIVFVGDSVTADTKTNFVSIILHSLAEKINVTNVSIVNSGVDSSSILDALDRLPEILSESDPEVMVIFIGINDSKIFHFINRPLIDVEVFKESYAAFLKRADVPRKRKKILINLPPLLFDQIREGDYLKDFWYWDSKLYAKYNRAIRDLAKDHDCLVADIHSVFENENKVNLFNDDGVHPNIYGHQLIANEVLKALNHLSE